MRRLASAVISAIVLIVVAVVVGALLPRPLFVASADKEPVTRRILLLSGPIHTDIALPLDASTRAAFAFLRPAGVDIDNPGAEWLVVGWGGRAFYLQTPTWGDLKPMPVFKALTVDRSVIHADLAGPIAPDGPATTALDLSEAGYWRMVDFMIASFARSQDLVMPIAGAGYGDFDQFFEADGRFNVLIGCNTWTAGALRAAGLRTGWWNPLPQSLSFSLSLLN
ncbi:MAG: TIGR02117 family protein [Allorhizobium sp.]